MPKKKRLTGEEARERILDATLERLQSVGPAGLKLTEIARDLGLSHPAILHHFGSRAGLVRAVVRRAIDGLDHELRGGLPLIVDPEKGAEMLVGRAFEVIHDRGYGRLLAWLALSGRTTDAGYAPLERLAETLHAVRTREVGETDPEDTTFVLLLVTCALVGYAILTPEAFRVAGLDDEAAERFRSWVHTAVLRLLKAPEDEGEPAPPGSAAGSASTVR